MQQLLFNRMLTRLFKLFWAPTPPTQWKVSKMLEQIHWINNCWCAVRLSDQMFLWPWVPTTSVQCILQASFEHDALKCLHNHLMMLFQPLPECQSVVTSMMLIWVFLSYICYISWCTVTWWVICDFVSCSVWWQLEIPQYQMLAHIANTFISLLWSILQVLG